MAFRLTFIRGIMLVSLSAVAALPLFTFFHVYPSFSRLVIGNAEQEAERIARHLPSMLPEEELMSGFTLSPEFQRHIEQVRQEFGLIKVKIFSQTGRVVYSSDSNDMAGHPEEGGVFHTVVAKGNIFSEVVKRDSKTLEGVVTKRDLAEIYVPLMSGNRFKGALEIYMDITERLERLDSLMRRLHATTSGIALVLFAAVLISTQRTLNVIRERNLAEERVRGQGVELKEANSELSALYEVSSAISKTMDPYELFGIILDTITGLGSFGFERKGGIFLIEGERLRLVSHFGYPDEFLAAHRDIKVGDCLCGLAAKTGEVIISKNSETDKRHTIKCLDIAPHGHIVVPLKSPNGLVGVLYLSLTAGFDIDEQRVKLLESIGIQIGTAIENAKLYEETKTLALRDPLTRLPNRRLLDLTLERLCAMSERYGSPLSAIMLDIDDFKKYNDAYGHSAGDELLVQIAGVVSNDLRQADIGVRYGGEEFLILLPETGVKEAVETAERIRKAVSDKTPVTVSVGVAAYEPQMTGKRLIDRADFAMYRAKKSGKNRVLRSE